jgi:TrmH family RNA methyltransferase
MPSVVLVQPSNPGNVGAVCRLMKNFGSRELVLLDPRCELGDEARRRAKHAGDVLDSARRASSWDEAVAGFDLVVGTTAVRASERNVRRSFVTPRALAERLAGARGRAALVLGRDGEGLHADELERCGVVVTIPSSPEYPTLNISHAAAIILYELWLASAERDPWFELAHAEEKRAIERSVGALTDALALPPGRASKVALVVRRVLDKSFLTRQEAYALAGFFRELVERQAGVPTGRRSRTVRAMAGKGGHGG